MPKRGLPLVIVAALGRNRAIGRDNALPWAMPSDLARFRRLTMGTPMIMGRRTFASIGRSLPGRESIVVTRDPAFAVDDAVFRAGSPEEALSLAGQRAAAMGSPSITLIGGAMVFDAMMEEADRMALTFVDLAPDADTYFPPIDPMRWREVARSAPPRHAGDDADCVFVDYERVGPDHAGDDS